MPGKDDATAREAGLAHGGWLRRVGGRSGPPPSTTTFARHAATVVRVSVDTPDDRAVSLGADGSLMVWDLGTGARLSACTAPVPVSNVVDVALGTAGSAHRILLTTAAGRLEVLRAADGKVEHSVAVWPGPPPLLLQVCGGRSAAFTVTPHEIQLIDLERGERIGGVRGKETGPPSVALSANGRRAIVARADGTLEVWDPAGDRLTPLAHAHRSPIQHVAIDAAGRRALSGDGDGLLQCWDLEPVTVTGTVQASAGPGVWMSLRVDAQRALWSAVVPGPPDTKGYKPYSRYDDVRPELWSAPWAREVWDTGRGIRVRLIEGRGADPRFEGRQSPGWRAVALREQTWEGPAQGSSNDGEIFPQTTFTDLETDVRIGTWDAPTISSPPQIHFHPDGRRVLSVGAGVAEIRDLEDRSRPPFTLPRNHISAAAFCDEGRGVLAGFDDGCLMRWSLEEAESAAELPPDEEAEPPLQWGPLELSLAFLPTGERLAVACGSGLELLAFPSGARLNVVGGRTRERGVHLSADGCRALAPCSQVMACIDVLEGQALWQRPVRKGVVALHPDGRRAITGDSFDGWLHLWNLEAPDDVRVLGRTRLKIAALAVHSDGSRLLACGDYLELEVWDLEGGRRLGREPSPLVSGERLRALSPSWRLAVTTHDSGMGHLWNLEGGHAVQLAELPRGAATKVALHPDGVHAVLATWGEGPVVTLWNLAEVRPIRKIKLPVRVNSKGGPADVKSMAISPDGRLLLVQCSHPPVNPVMLCELETGRVQWQKEECGYDGLVSFSADGRHGFLELSLGWSVLDLQTMAPVLTLDLPHSRSMSTAYLSPQGLIALPDGRRALCMAHVQDYETSGLWDLERGSCTRIVEMPPPPAREAVERELLGARQQLQPELEHKLVFAHGKIRSFSLRPDGALAAAAFDDRVLRIVEVSTGRVVASWESAHPLRACAIGPAGEVALVDESGELLLFRLEGGR